MKLKIYFLVLTAAISITTVLAQPVIGSQKTIGTSGDDIFTCMSLTKDSGFIIGGYSGDFWILLLNNNGAIRAQKTIGGSGGDYLRAVEQTTDGGYILGGHSSSDSSGDKTQNSRGKDDYWIVKLDSNGKIQWNKTIGGSSDDYLRTIKQTSDGGYIAGGYSTSNISGEKTENTRGTGNEGDYWVVKLDGNGNIQWDKTIGGKALDVLTEIILTSDNGYLLGGYSRSPVSGEKTDSSRGIDDFWVVKLDNAGNVQWDKTYGGNRNDNLMAMLPTKDGGYLLGGTTSGPISGEKMQPSHGYDYWLIKTDRVGQIEWSNTYGGHGHDYLSSLQPTSDGGYMLGGDSEANMSGQKTENSRGGSDYWIIKLSGTGTIQWDKTIGGTDREFNTKTKEIGRNLYIIAGTSPSDIGGDKTGDSKGGSDYWLVELKYKNRDSISVAALPNKSSLQINEHKNHTGFFAYPNPAKEVLHINTTGKASFSLSDQSGNIKLTKTIKGNAEINVANLPAGIYYLKNNTTGVTQKIFITK